MGLYYLFPVQIQEKGEEARCVFISAVGYRAFLHPSNRLILPKISQSSQWERNDVKIGWVYG